MYPDLADRHVLVTGGASGIGACMVMAFAQQGATVTFIDNDVSAAQSLLDSNCINRVHFIESDLRDLPRLHEIIQGIPLVDILINNAARDDRHHPAEVTPELWEYLMNVNLRHYFFASQAVVDRLLQHKRHGVVINLGSITSLYGHADLSVYTTAKGGIVSLTKSLARKWGPQGIRVNCILPGWVLTERQQRLWLTDEANERRLASQSLKEWIMPSDIANMALFLASAQARMCTGQMFVVDGGAT